MRGLGITVLFVLSWRAFSQSPPAFSLPSGAITVAITRTTVDSLVRLPDQFVAAGTDSVTLDSVHVLVRGTDYTLDHRKGILRLHPSIGGIIRADSTRAEHLLQIRYKYFPFRFQDSYFHRQLVALKDATGADTLRVARPRSAFSIDEIFGPTIQKSGSIVRGFTVGSNRDLSLNSGLRMQLSGRLGSDIDIAATLTDENTPLQPEGTTQTLQEFDKVFVEIKSSNLAATLGDFVLELPGTEFARVNRKLQGAKGDADFRWGTGGGSVEIAGAVTRGKFATNQFTGLEGVQGPYRLTGRNGERSIIVIAGTERVYLNGELQVRGETNSYTIDYATGEVTFTPRTLVTAASRIVIDFEYTDRQYSRSLLAAQTQSRFFGNKAAFRFTFLREADDPDAPIDLTLSDSARAVLRAAGADRNKAVLNGVTPVDSNGVYMRIDTTLGTGAQVSFYRYAPGDARARYIVTFSSVGFGKGEYTREQVGVFVWRGPGAGDYLPIRTLPLPELQQVVDFALDAVPAQDLTLSGEYARSVFDANRLSSVDDDKNGGYAFKFGAAFAPRSVRLGGTDLGAIDFRFNERFVNKRFVPLDRSNDIEFNRKWGIDTTAVADEEIREAALKYSPVKSLTVGGGYGSITRGDVLRSTRSEGSFVMHGDSLPSVNYTIEDVQSTDRSLDNRSSWLRQKGTAEYRIWKMTPHIRFEGEDRENKGLSSGLAGIGSFSFRDVAPGVTFTGLGPVTLSAELGWRTDDMYQNGAVQRASRSFTQTYGGRLAEWNDLSTSLDVTLRKKRFTPPFTMAGNPDITTVLIRSQSRYTPLQRAVETDVFYEVATERSSKLERVFVRVAQGTGNYTYLGDLNHNGLADEDEFVPTRFDGDFIAVTTPTDAFVPIIDLKASARVRLTPSRLLGTDGNGLSRILSVVSTETYARVEEKSSEGDLKQIYLLHFSRFQRDATTIAGSRYFTQDLFLWENRPEFSARFRFGERRGLTNFSGGIERTYTRERSIRLRLQLVPEVANQLDYANKIDRLGSAQQSNRLRNILTDDVTFDFSYRPEQKVEIGFKFEVARSTDRNPAPALTADLNVQSVRWVYSFEGAGQARVEGSREEILLGKAVESFPYELTGGRVAGKTWIWRAAFDYRMTQFLQATTNYEGRSEGGRPVVHTARAEVRAFF
jgi:hypothetical protein